MTATLVIMGGLIVGLLLGGPAGATASAIIIYTMLSTGEPPSFKG